MIHIAYTINSGYVKYCGVAMLSAARSAPGQRFSFHVIANDLTQADREFLSKLGAKENAKVSFYAVPDELASRYKVTWDANRLPLLVYYRCFLASLLPKDVERSSTWTVTRWYYTHCKSSGRHLSRARPSPPAATRCNSSQKEPSD